MRDSLEDNVMFCCLSKAISFNNEVIVCLCSVVIWERVSVIRDFIISIGKEFVVLWYEMWFVYVSIFDVSVDNNICVLLEFKYLLLGWIS